MKYDKEKLEEQALIAIKELDLVFFSDVVACLPCSRRTAFNLELNKSENILEALEQNKVITKSLLRKYWLATGSATAQIALYKLVATDEERAILSNKPAQDQAEEKGKFTGFNFLPGGDTDDEPEAEAV